MSPPWPRSSRNDSHHPASMSSSKTTSRPSSSSSRRAGSASMSPVTAGSSISGSCSEGQMFGEGGMLDGGPRVASAVALDPSTVLAIPRARMAPSVGRVPQRGPADARGGRRLVPSLHHRCDAISCSSTCRSRIIPLRRACPRGARAADRLSAIGVGELPEVRPRATSTSKATPRDQNAVIDAMTVSCFVGSPCDVMVIGQR